MKTINKIMGLAVAIAVAGSAHAATIPDSYVAPETTGTVTVTGRVVTSDKKPVSDARVYIPGTEAATRTDAQGNYTLTNVPDGPQEVVVRSRGYAPARVDAKFSTKRSDWARNHVNITLLTEAEAGAVAAQRATDSAGLARRGFFQRQSSMRGAYFITPDDIAGTRAARVSDLFRGVPVLVQTSGRYGQVLRGVQGCLITYVDGLRWRTVFPGDLDASVPVGDVVGAEVYPPGRLPPVPFTRGTSSLNCTALAIWTRSSMG